MSSYVVALALRLLKVVFRTVCFFYSVLSVIF